MLLLINVIFKNQSPSEIGWARDWSGLNSFGLQSPFLSEVLGMWAKLRSKST